MSDIANRIAMTGSTGFLGRKVATALREMGVEIIEVVRPGRAKSIKSQEQNREWIVEADFDDPRSDLLDTCGNPDTFLHLAWGRLNDYTSPEHLSVELPRHVRFLTHLFETGQRRVVVAGTCFEYGLSEGSLSESLDVAPVTEYATAKVRLHEELRHVCQKFGASLIWLRLFYLYGSGQPARTLWGQFQAALANESATFRMSLGDQTRDYLPANEMASQIARLAVIPIHGVITTNVCSGQPIRVRDLVCAWVKESGKHITLDLGALPYAQHEPRHAWGDAKTLNLLLQKTEHLLDIE